MTREHGRGDDRTAQPLLALLSALVLMLGAVGVSACGGDEEQAADEGQGARTETAQALTVTQALARADQSQGQEVTVRGIVLRAVAPGAFTLAEPSAAVTEPEDVEDRLPLLLTEGAQPPGLLQPASAVRVRGTLQRMSEELLARREFAFEETDEEADVLEEFANSPVMVATSAEIEAPPSAEE